MSARRASPQRPWPMKWVVLTLVVGLALYTYLTLHFRKPDSEYRPYEDFTKRANVQRLLKAGYRRIETAAERPADTAQILRAMGPAASITEVAGGLPAELAGTFIEAPLLPLTITSVSAPRQATGLLPYSVLFDCKLPNQKEQFGGSLVFIRDHTLVIVPQFEALAGGLLARTKESLVAVTLPPGTLPAGPVTVTLAASQSSKQWTVDVKE